MNFFGKDLQKEDYLLYSIKHFSRESGIKGRKKLMKLMFFLEHLNLEQDELVPDRCYGKNEFIIYNYGPFSFDVMNNIEKLKGENKVTEKQGIKPFVISLTKEGKDKAKKIGEKLSKEKIQRVEKIKERFISKPGWKLEKESLEYLGITEEDKNSLKGTPVRVVISEKNS